MQLPFYRAKSKKFSLEEMVMLLDRVIRDMSGLHRDENFRLTPEAANLLAEIRARAVIISNLPALVVKRMGEKQK